MTNKDLRKYSKIVVDGVEQAPSRATGAKRVAQKIKADSRVLLRTTPILTVHDTRLVEIPIARV